MKSISVGLLTCERVDYTRRTIESFLRFNDPARFELLHIDDGSADDANLKLAEMYGFKSFDAYRERRGQIECLRHLLKAASCEHYLHLENDWEWLAPFPWDMMCHDWECLRLYGEEKSPGRGARRTLIGTSCEIEWQTIWAMRPESRSVALGEAAIAHWAGPPSVCRTADLRRVARDAASFKDVSLRFRPYTWRLREAIVNHSGKEQTPGFKA